MRELIWSCLGCDVNLVSIDGKRRLETNNGLKPYTPSWDRYLSLTRNCQHEHKQWSPDYCKRCGRRIINPTSLKHKMGPICRCKVQDRARQSELEQEIKVMEAKVEK